MAERFSDINSVTRMLFLTLILALNCQKYSSLVYQPSLICRNLRSNICYAYSPQSKKDYFQKKDYYDKLKGGSTSTHKKGGKFETQLEVDIFIENNLNKCSKTDISTLFTVLADVSKKNRKDSFLKNHLTAIALQLKQLSSSWTFQEISGVVYGLQYMTGDDEGVMDILSVMTLAANKNIKSIEIMQTLQRQHISMLLYGLLNMSSRHEVVRNLLSVVATMILDCDDKFNPQAIGNSFYGLQGMSSDSSSVRDVLSALTVKMLGCKENFSAQQVGNAFYGLQGINWIENGTVFISLISFLRFQVKIIGDDISLSTSLSPGRLPSKIATKDLVTLSQSLVLLLPEISSIVDTEEYKDLNAMSLLLTDELGRRRRDGDSYYKYSELQSSAERRLYNIAAKVCQNSVTEIRVKSYLFNLFDGDIVLEVPPNGGSSNTIIQIEVISINHNHGKTMTFCERKTKYLKSKGVFVSRIDTFVINKMKDIELEEWVKGIVSHAITDVSSDTLDKTTSASSTIENGTKIIGYNSNVNHPAEKIKENNDESITNLTSKLRRYISDEQKNANNARARERRKIKSDEKKLIKDL